MRNPGNSLTSTILLYSDAVATPLASQCTPKVGADPTGGEQCSVTFFDCVGDAVGKLEPTPAACTSGGTGRCLPSRSADDHGALDRGEFGERDHIVGVASAPSRESAANGAWRAHCTGLDMTLRRIAAASLFLLLASPACTSHGEQCDPPAQTTYSCTPLVTANAPAGTVGCVGGKGRLGSTDTPNADETFPIGCTATLPECAGAYQTEVQTCQCEPTPTIDGGTAPQWTCLI